MRRYDVINPANQAELTSMIRNRELAGMALQLIVVEASLDELAIRRGDVAEKAELDFLVDNIVGLYDIPYLTGRVAKQSMDGITEIQYGARLEVHGDDSTPEIDRALSLYVSEE